MPFSRKTGRPASYCNATVDFDPADLEEIKEDLAYAWPNWPVGEVTKWEMEWKKFGTCIANKVETIVTPLDYFKKGNLQLLK